MNRRVVSTVDLSNLSIPFFLSETETADGKSAGSLYFV